MYDLEIVFDDVVAVEEHETVAATSLGDAEPNPFDSSVAIFYETRVRGEVRLSIHDVGGRLVRTLVQDQRPAGRYQVVWSGHRR